MLETITLRNELPELLEAVCEHPDCPAWLRNDIWDSFNDNAAHITYKASYWRSYLEGEDVPMDDPRDFDRCRMGCGSDAEVYGRCIPCTEKVIAQKRDVDWPEQIR